MKTTIKIYKIFYRIAFVIMLCTIIMKCKPDNGSNPPVAEKENGVNIFYKFIENGFEWVDSPPILFKHESVYSVLKQNECFDGSCPDEPSDILDFIGIRKGDEINFFKAGRPGMHMQCRFLSDEKLFCTFKGLGSKVQYDLRRVSDDEIINHRSYHEPLIILDEVIRLYPSMTGEFKSHIVFELPEKTPVFFHKTGDRLKMVTKEKKRIVIESINREGRSRIGVNGEIGYVESKYLKAK
ncbi:MAG: hypothetical protein JJT78_12885 [Leptospira sp.]|nr:hypothetical protein [Leptospira sp.]